MLVPYYNTEYVRLYKGDCREVLQQLPEESVDLVFADPPYNLSNGGITCQAGRMVSVNKGAWDKSKGVENDHAFALEWLAACRRVLRDDGTIWVSGTMHNIYSIGFALQELGFRLLNDVSWFKPNASPNLSCRYFTHSHETLLWASKSDKSKHRFNYELARQMAGGKQMRSVWYDILENGLGDIWEITTPGPEEKTFGKHPTQKPLTLLERVILTTSNPGDIVLDPFTGSSTTGLACIKHGRKFIGIEIEEAFLRLSVKRLEREEHSKKTNPMLLAVKEGRKKCGRSGVLSATPRPIKRGERRKVTPRNVRGDD